jgi:hypothetical protein
MTTKNVNLVFAAQNKAGPAMKGFQRDLHKSREAIKTMQPLQASWNRGLNANRRMVQQLGFQLTDFSTQIAGGQSAMLAFIQQGGQMLQFFGPFGAMAAAALAVFGSLGLAFIKSGKSMSELTPIMGVLADQFAMIGVALGHLKEIMIDVANVILNNMDTILIAATLVATWFALNWVRSMVLAKVATLGLGTAMRAFVLSLSLVGPRAAAAMVATGALTGAMNLLRTALMRLGIPALIIAAAYLIERFMALVKATGGFGNALTILGDLAREVFRGIGGSGSGLYDILKGVALGIASVFVGAFASILEAWGKLIDKIKPVWDLLASVPGLGLGLKVMGAVSDSGVTESLRSTSDALKQDALSTISSGGAKLNEAFGPAKDKLSEIRDLIKETKIDIRDWFGGDGTGEGGGGSGGAAAKAKEQVTEIEKAFKDMQETISQSLMSSFKSLLKGTMSLGDAVRDLLSKILDKVIDVMMTPLFNSAAGFISKGIFGGLGLMSFDGGGRTPSTPRAGGMDGKGGRVALLHPNETVVPDGASGGSGTTVYMTVNTPDAESFRRSQRQIEQRLAAGVQRATA